MNQISPSPLQPSSAPRVRDCWPLLLPALWLISGCGSADPLAGHAPTPPAPVVVSVATVSVSPVQRRVAVVGTLAGDEEATVSSRVPGPLLAIFHDVGDRIAIGEPLAQIDQTTFRLAAAQKDLALGEALAKLGLDALPADSVDLDHLPAVQRAKAQADNLNAKFERLKGLSEQRPPLVSDQDLADARTQRDIALGDAENERLSARALLAVARSRKADLDAERQRFGDTTVRAPDLHAVMAGDGRIGKPAEQARYVVSERLVSAGEYVKEGTPLFHVIDDHLIKWRCRVPERQAGELALDQRVEIRVDEIGDLFSGRVARIAPRVDPINRTVPVEVEIANPAGKLASGAFAHGAILTRSDPRAVFVPRDAVVAFAGISKVFVIKDGKAAAVAIETGEQNGELIEVTKGLIGGESVAISGISRLSDGTAVSLATPAANGSSAEGGGSAK